MLLKHLDRNKYRDSYDSIFGKKEQFKFDKEAEAPKVVKRKYGKIKVENIKKYE